MKAPARLRNGLTVHIGGRRITTAEELREHVPALKQQRDEIIAAMLGQAAVGTRQWLHREPNPMWHGEPVSLEAWTEAVLENAWFAEPELAITVERAHFDVHFRRLTAVGPKGRKYSRCLVLERETEATVRTKARELGKAIAKAARR